MTAPHTLTDAAVVKKEGSAQASPTVRAGCRVATPTPQVPAAKDQTVPGKYGTAFTEAGAALCREIGDGYYATQYQPEKWNALAEVNARIQRMRARAGKAVGQ